jgi:hypothetical protein
MADNSLTPAPTLAHDPRPRWPPLPDHSHRRRTKREGDARAIHASVLAGDRFNPDANGDDATGDPGTSLVATPPGHSGSEKTTPASDSIDIIWRSSIEREPGNE